MKTTITIDNDGEHVVELDVYFRPPNTFERDQISRKTMGLLRTLKDGDADIRSAAIMEVEQLSAKIGANLVYKVSPPDLQLPEWAENCQSWKDVLAEYFPNFLSGLVNQFTQPRQRADIPPEKLMAMAEQYLGTKKAEAETTKN